MSQLNQNLRDLRALVDPPDAEDDTTSCWDQLFDRILILSDYAWERRIDRPAIERWLSNFDGKTGLPISTERLHALYLLSQFLYFGVREIRVLLRALYRDLCLVPLIQEIRQANGGTRDLALIRRELDLELSFTKFLGVGNPSESGVHLLYYFRQENELSKYNFLDAARIFTGSGAARRVTDTKIRRYIFLDDVCGSGETAVNYSRDFLEELQASVPNAHIAYHCMFATEAGLSNLQNNTVFQKNAKAVFELDESYRSLTPQSRYFKICPPPIDIQILARVALTYGELVCPGDAGGFNDGQLLLGFSHNIPDNTLPIIWNDPTNGSPVPWTAAFRRYMKV